MKFLETHFDDYIQSCKKYNLHPKLLPFYEKYPSTHLPNTIFYGPPGSGKYTQALFLIKRYSPSELKYEKRMLISYESNPIYIKVSDIHFEVNMAMLGCNSKILWNEIYTQIVDVVSTRPHTSGIIMCKNFHTIHSELLDVFYSYFRCSNPKIHISFVIVTDHLSFITTNVINACETIHVKRPTALQYKKCITTTPAASATTASATTATANPDGLAFISKLTDSDVAKISNIKSLKLNRIRSAEYESEHADAETNSAFQLPHTTTCTRIFKYIIQPDTIQLLEFRDALYDILICDLDIYGCIWLIVKNLIHHLTNNGVSIPTKTMTDIITNTYTFLHMFNNNYRPIYHLERFIFMLINHTQNITSL